LKITAATTRDELVKSLVAISIKQSDLNSALLEIVTQLIYQLKDNKIFLPKSSHDMIIKQFREHQELRKIQDELIERVEKDGLSKDV
jgi:hypothetical protein